MAFLKRQRTKPAFMQILSEMEERTPAPRGFLPACRSKYHSYARWMTRRARRMRVGLNMAELPTQDEVTSQGKILCKEYIYRRLKKVGLYSLKPEMELMGEDVMSFPSLSDVSRELQLIGGELEKLYPDLYNNISKQLNVSLVSELTVVKTFRAVGDGLFTGGVTWGRVVALFCLTGAFSVDAIQQGHPQYVRPLVDTFGSIVSQQLSTWIIQQGGWTDIIRTFRTSKEAPAVWFLSVAGALFGFVLTVLATVQI